MTSKRNLKAQLVAAADMQRRLERALRKRTAHCRQLRCLLDEAEAGR